MMYGFVNDWGRVGFFNIAATLPYNIKSLGVTVVVDWW